MTDAVPRGRTNVARHASTRLGAVVLARRRAGLETPGHLSVGELMRGETDHLGAGTTSSAPAGTQAEAAGIQES